MGLADRLGGDFGGGGADERRRVGVVQMLVDLCHAAHHFERALVLAAIVEREDIVDGAALEADQIAALDQVAVRGTGRHVLDLRFIEPGRQHVDQVERTEQLGVLAVGHAGRDEDAEVANRRMQAIDDGLLVGHDLVHVRVEIGNPVQRLLGRRDVVPP
ncbi:hypothetical protein D3C81_1639900 [compost metagenome]